MIKVIVMTLVMMVAAVTSSYGVQRISYAEDKVITGKISPNDLNRIQIEGDRVIEILGLSDSYEVDADSRSGQIFIKKLRVGDEAAVFTAITEKKLAIDFKLEPLAKSGETIIVETVGNIGEEDSSLGIALIKHKQHEYLVSLIKGLARSYDTSVDKGVLREQKLGKLVAKLMQVKREGGYTLEVWEVRNLDNCFVSLEEKGFGKVIGGSEIRAVALENRILGSNESTKLYVVRNAKKIA